MSEITEDDRNAATPIAGKAADDAAGTARPLGLIGLGALGLPLAARAARRHALLACDVDPARLSLLMDRAERPRRVHTTLVVEEVAERCDVVALALPSSREVEAVIGQMERVLRAGSLVIDMGWSVPAETRRHAANL